MLVTTRKIDTASVRWAAGLIPTSRSHAPHHEDAVENGVDELFRRRPVWQDADQGILVEVGGDGLPLRPQGHERRR